MNKPIKDVVRVGGVVEQMYTVERLSFQIDAGVLLPVSISYFKSKGMAMATAADIASKHGLQMIMAT